jgi:hypothetical protein
MHCLAETTPTCIPIEHHTSTSQESKPWCVCYSNQGPPSNKLPIYNGMHPSIHMCIHTSCCWKQRGPYGSNSCQSGMQ